MWEKLKSLPGTEGASTEVTNEAGEKAAVRVWVSSDGHYRTSLTEKCGGGIFSTLAAKSLEPAKAEALATWKEQKGYEAT